MKASQKCECKGTVQRRVFSLQINPTNFKIRVANHQNWEEVRYSIWCRRHSCLVMIKMEQGQSLYLTRSKVLMLYFVFILSFSIIRLAPNFQNHDLCGNTRTYRCGFLKTSTVLKNVSPQKFVLPLKNLVDLERYCCHWLHLEFRQFNCIISLKGQTRKLQP